ncbi:MAG: hypothetical protein ACT4OS_11625 [Acidimicrobiales bacterium]
MTMPQWPPAAEPMLEPYPPTPYGWPVGVVQPPADPAASYSPGYAATLEPRTIDPGAAGAVHNLAARPAYPAADPGLVVTTTYPAVAPGQAVTNAYTAAAPGPAGVAYSPVPTLQPPPARPEDSTSGSRSGGSGPGSLGIIGPRTWSTKRLAAACVGALLIGLLAGYGQRDSPNPLEASSSSSSSSSGDSTSAPTDSAPVEEAPADGAPSDAAPADGAPGATGSDGDPAAPASGDPSDAAPVDGAPSGSGAAADPATDPAGGADPGAPGSGAAPEILVEVKPVSGPVDSPSFRVAAGGWQLGWAFDCSQAGGTGAFEIEIANPDGTPSGEEPIRQEGSAGKSVNAYTTTGERILSVTTNCLWTAKVTGVRG